MLTVMKSKQKEMYKRYVQNATIQLGLEVWQSTDELRNINAVKRQAAVAVAAHRSRTPWKDSQLPKTSSSGNKQRTIYFLIY